MKFLPIALLIFITVNGQSRFIPHYAHGDSNWVYMIDSNEYRWYPLYYTPRQDTTIPALRQKWTVEYNQCLQDMQIHFLFFKNDSIGYKRCLYGRYLKRDSAISYENAMVLEKKSYTYWKHKADSLYRKIDSLNCLIATPHVKRR